MIKSNRDIVRQYFSDNPNKLKGNFGKTARELGISYNTVWNVATAMKKQELAVLVHENDSTSSTETSEDGYESIEQLKNSNSLKSYCDAYGIPYEYVTSAKFINHNFQEVWNVVCDTTKLTPQYLDTYFEKLKTALRAEVKPITFDTNKEVDPNVAFHFYHSDKHVAAMNGPNTLYKNEYNSEIFEARLLKTLEDYVEEGQIRGGFDKVLVSDLGDSVDGWNKGTTRFGKGSSHILPQNLDNRETFDVYVAAMCRFFDQLVALDLANDIEFIAVSNDNHGGGFSYIVNRGVEIYLNLKYPQIKTKVAIEFIPLYEYGVHGFLLTHGKDEEFMKHGMPLNLDKATEEKLNQYIRRKDVRKQYMHVIKGDLHQSAKNLVESFRYRNVLSLYGSSGHAMMNYGFNFPGSSYEIVYKNKNKILEGDMIFE